MRIGFPNAPTLCGNGFFDERPGGMTDNSKFALIQFANGNVAGPQTKDSGPRTQDSTD